MILLIVELKAIAKRNAEIVLRYSTVFPFRLQGQNLICVYCCDAFQDPDEYRQHFDSHPHVNMSTAFAHLKGAAGREYLKVDCVNLRCKLCNEPFNSLPDIAQHLKHTHEDVADTLNLDCEVGMHPYRLLKDKWTCMLCQMKLPSLTTLTRHMSSHYADFVCDVCGRGYLNITNLKIHVKFTHSEKHICRKCMKEFPTAKEKKEHYKTSTKCMQFACIHCGERFSSWEKKIKHLTSEHNVKATKYPCTDCELVFPTRKNFYSHYVVSHTDQALKCSCCDKKFLNKTLLEEHLITHTNEKPFECSVCSKLFTRNKALRQHMWIHSEKKRFTCVLCDRSFNQKVSYLSHMKSTHPNASI